MGALGREEAEVKAGGGRLLLKGCKDGVRVLEFRALDRQENRWDWNAPVVVKRTLT